MSERVQKIQDNFNKLGSELLQVELGIARFKDALTKANDRKHTIMQKLINLDDEYQKIKYAGLKVNESPEQEKDSNDEIKFKTTSNEAPSEAPEPTTAG